MEKEDNINIRKDNYPSTESELTGYDKENPLEGKILADMDSPDGPITILNDGEAQPNIVYVSIGNVTIHMKEESFYVLTKAIQRSAKTLLDL